jgi:hypothetical protein
VIARNSSFTYKGRAGIDIRQVGRELGVRYPGGTPLLQRDFSRAAQEPAAARLAA